MNARRLISVIVGSLLVVLCIVPFVLIAPKVIDSHKSFSRLFEDREPVPAVRVEPARFRPPAESRSAVPVLAYHGIAEQPQDRLTITPEQFAHQLAMLRAAGFHAISAEQYAAKDLPSRPILITFDDGRLDSFKHADQVLERYGMRATMFVITGNADERRPAFLQWDELRDMRDSGRWDVQLHAARQHTTVRDGAAYANRAPGESWERYTARVTADVDEGIARLRDELDAEPLLFAAPYRAPGELQSNDERIPKFLDELLHDRFEQVFTSGRPKTPPPTAQHTLRRYEIRDDTTAKSLYRWLSRKEA